MINVMDVLSVCQNLRNIEHLQPADDGSNQRIGENRAYHRESDIKESLYAAAAVQFRCLEDIRADSHNCCHKHNGRIAKPHQEIHEADQEPRSENGTEKINRRFHPSQGKQNRIDRPSGRKHSEKQHGKG